MDELTEEEKREVEEYMERSMHRRCVIGDITTLFVVILIILAVFFPDTLNHICHMISKVTRWIL